MVEISIFGIPVVAFDVGGIREWLKLGGEGQRIVKEKFSRKKHIEKLINI